MFVNSGLQAYSSTIIQEIFSCLSDLVNKVSVS